MKKSPREIAVRRRSLIRLLADEEGCSLQDALGRLRPKPGRRTIHSDLAWLKSTFPHQMVRQRAAPKDTSRIAYRWNGAIPNLLENPISWLSEDELIVLVAAQGLLRNSDDGTLDGLSAVAEDFLKRSGALETARAMQRHILTVSRFGAAPMSDPTNLSICLKATATGEGIIFEYTNLSGLTHTINAAPQRLVLIRGEWYCVAWAKGLGMYKLARMAQTVRSKLPIGMPHVMSSAVDDLLADSFYATGNTEPNRRVRIVLAISPGAWPFVGGRTWGRKQKVDELPDGWRALSFTTAGIAECRHWVLSMGTGVRPLEPKELVDFVRAESREMSKGEPRPKRIRKNPRPDEDLFGEPESESTK